MKTKIFKAIIPLFLFVLMFFAFLKFGPLGVFTNWVAPIEKAFIQKVVFLPEHIKVGVYNDGPEPVIISQILMNNAFWKFEMKPDHELKPREKGEIDIFYPWSTGDPITVILLSSNGVTFEKEVEAAAITPQFSTIYLKAFILLGVYVGVIPVLLGLLWLPFLRSLKDRWFGFFLSLTVGLLIFLGVDAVSESFDLMAKLPETFNGVGIFLIGFLLAILVLSSISHKTQHLIARKESHFKALLGGYLIALGIGVHNLGEGLAIGSAYSVGEISLGASLVIGFMAHNMTEGIAIVTPVSRTIRNIRDDFWHLVAMGLLAGAPTILGTIIGGFSYSDEIAVFFLAIGAGAIFDVAFDIINGMKKGSWLSLFRVSNALGFLTGLLIMYLTGFLVV